MAEVHILSGSTQDFATFIRYHLPEGTFSRIVIKPNWVKHQEHSEFPISALVTSSRLIDLVITACIERYPQVEKITICDVPLQTCDWTQLCKQAGLAQL